VAYGAGSALLLDPTLIRDLGGLSPALRLPTPSLPAVTWADLAQGTLVLAIPQAALTLGNAVVATAEEHNALFPARRVSVRLLALDHGVVNLVAAALGGVPMCRGAGGMVGDVRFGPRTGEALVILGVLLLAAALFLGESIGTLFRLFPMPVLGVILFFGLELASSVASDGFSQAERTVLVVTAGLALWNMGAAYLAGLALHHAPERRLVRL
jgi:MFS superfamily sulfate permease-like transporter